MKGVFVLREVLVITVSAVAAAWDLRFRKVPNWLVLAGLISGAAVNAILLGPYGLWISAGGAAFGMAILAIPYVLGGIGAGDVKLLGCLGAILGPQRIIPAALYGLIAGGVISAGLLAFRGKFGSASRSLIANFALTLIPGARPAGLGTMKTASSSSLIPYAVPIGIGAALEALLGLIE